MGVSMPSGATRTVGFGLAQHCTEACAHDELMVKGKWR